MAYLNYTTKTTDTTDDLINLGLNEFGLIIDGQKTTIGAPDTNSDKYIPGAFIQNTVSSLWYQNTGSTSVPVWTVVSGGGGGTPGGVNTSVQYNNAGSFYGDSLFTRDATTNETMISQVQGGQTATLGMGTTAFLGVAPFAGAMRSDAGGISAVGAIDGTAFSSSVYSTAMYSRDFGTNDSSLFLFQPNIIKIHTDFNNSTLQSARIDLSSGANGGIDMLMRDISGSAYGFKTNLNNGFPETQIVYNSYDWNWPHVDGLTGQVLTTDGAGNLDFAYAGTGDIGALNVRVATTAVLPGAPTYNNGVAGVGATLTRSSNGTVGTIDGITPFSIGDRILVKNQASTLENGVYEVTTVGSAGVPYVLTRTTDADTTAALDDMVVIASLGTTNKGIPFGQQTNNPTIGVSAIVFTQTTIYIKQQTSGTQAVNQIPVYTATARTLTKGTSSFTYSPTTNLLSIGGVVRSSDLHNNALAQGNATQQDVRSGTYTPTGTAGTNVTGLTPSDAQWLRVGNVVTVSGHVLVQVTGAAVCDWELSVPVNSTWTGNGNAGGTASRATGGTVDSLCFLQTVTNNRVQFLANTTASGIHVFSYQYTYVVI